MAYVPVPKDLNAIKTKVMFNLTKRQLICFGAGGLLGLPAFFLLKNHIGSTGAAMIMIAIVIPFFLMGMYEKNGQPFEVVLNNTLDVMFLKPKKRAYKPGKKKDHTKNDGLKNNISGCLERIFAVIKQLVTKKKPESISVQDSISFEKMFKDGICKVTDNYYTKTIKFNDINYQISSNEDKNTIFDSWCDFLNYFDSSVKFELSFVNMNGDSTKDAESINIPKRSDQFADIADEYQEFIKEQVSKGNNGIVKAKYLSFGIEASSLKSAKPRLERIETDLIQNFKKMGVSTHSLNGYERLELMHGMLHIGDKEEFSFSWDSLPESGKDVKDYISPSSLEFKTGKEFSIGRKVGAVSFLQILAPELNDRLLADFLDMESNLIVTMHVQSVDQVQAIKTVKRKITDLQKSKIEEQKKAVRAGYDMDIIPSDLSTYNEEAGKLLRDLQSRNERMFLLTFIVLNVADNQQQLGNNLFQASSIAQKYNCNLTRLQTPLKMRQQLKIQVNLLLKHHRQQLSVRM